MGIALCGSKSGTIMEVNVVPLIDILLVLLVIFMVMPNSQGLKAQIPHATLDLEPDPEVIAVHVLQDGSLRLNQHGVTWGALRDELQQALKTRADRTVFVRGDVAVEFALVAKAIDEMHSAGVSSVGLMTREVENGH